MSEFHGSDYVRERDHDRLDSGLWRVRSLMLDGEWRTPEEITVRCGLNYDGSATRYLRYLRDPEHGAHLVEKRARGDEANGLYEYKVHAAGSQTKKRRKGLRVFQRSDGTVWKVLNSAGNNMEFKVVGTP